MAAAGRSGARAHRCPAREVPRSAGCRRVRWSRLGSPGPRTFVARIGHGRVAPRGRGRTVPTFVAEIFVCTGSVGTDRGSTCRAGVRSTEEGTPALWQFLQTTEDAAGLSTCGRTVELRTRLRTGSPGQASGHGHDHRDVDHRFGVFGQGLVVAHAAAVLADPLRRRCRCRWGGSGVSGRFGVLGRRRLRWHVVVGLFLTAAADQ
jgi:hypothetical protein